MNKSQEIAVLKQTAKHLGENSYLGPWLAEQIPFLERDIESDLEPDRAYTFKECQLRCKNEIEAAEYRAKGIIEHAKAHAELIVKTAKNQDADIRKKLARDVKAAFEKVEQYI